MNFRHGFLCIDTTPCLKFITSTYSTKLLINSFPLFDFKSIFKPITVAAKKIRLDYRCFSLKNLFNSQQIESSVESDAYGKTSNDPFPTSLSNPWTIVLVFSLNMGKNVCKTLKLNVGFISFRNGFQAAPARNKSHQKTHEQRCTNWWLFE